MQIDATGFVLLIVVCSVFGFLIGWLGGVAEGRARERTEASRRMSVGPSAGGVASAPAHAPGCTCEAYACRFAREDAARAAGVIPSSKEQQK